MKIRNAFKAQDKTERSSANIVEVNKDTNIGRFKPLQDINSANSLSTRVLVVLFPVDKAFSDDARILNIKSISKMSERVARDIIIQKRKNDTTTIKIKKKT